MMEVGQNEDAVKREADPWERHVNSFQIHGATVTATPASDAVVFLAGLHLLVTEGREETNSDFTSDPPPASVLAPFCRVTMVDAPEPTSWSGIDASIVISGTHENVMPISITGPGSIGLDDLGNLEIAFEGLPQMAVILPSG